MSTRALSRGLASARHRLRHCTGPLGGVCSTYGTSPVGLWIRVTPLYCWRTPRIRMYCKFNHFQLMPSHLYIIKATTENRAQRILCMQSWGSWSLLSVCFQVFGLKTTVTNPYIFEALWYTNVTHSRKVLTAVCEHFIWFWVIAIGGRSWPGVCFLSGRMSWTHLPQECYGGGSNTKPLNWKAKTHPIAELSPPRNFDVGSIVRNSVRAR